MAVGAGKAGGRDGKPDPWALDGGLLKGLVARLAAQLGYSILPAWRVLALPMGTTAPDRFSSIGPVLPCAGGRWAIRLFVGE
jgi:hypothetical protein